jgi:hypothetical protein
MTQVKPIFVSQSTVNEDSSNVEFMISVSAVEEVLRSEDIEGLLELGAPRDEYADEARRIISALADVGMEDLTESTVTTAIQKTWIESFGPFSAVDIQKRIPAFQQVARHILNQAHTLSNV